MNFFGPIPRSHPSLRQIIMSSNAFQHIDIMDAESASDADAMSTNPITFPVDEYGVAGIAGISSRDHCRVHDDASCSKIQDDVSCTARKSSSKSAVDSVESLTDVIAA
jgi:hypothetical protein